MNFVDVDGLVRKKLAICTLKGLSKTKEAMNLCEDIIYQVMEDYPWKNTDYEKICKGFSSQQSCALGCFSSKFAKNIEEACFLKPKDFLGKKKKGDKK